MTSRFDTRIPVSMEGELISGNERYKAIIDNISEHGMCSRIPLEQKDKKYEIDFNVFLKLELPSGEVLNLKCTKRWADLANTDRSMENVGIEVIDPPQKYREFYWAMVVLLNSL